MSLAEPYDDSEDRGDGVENIDGRFVTVPKRMRRLRRDGVNCPIPFCSEITDGKKQLDPHLVIDALLSKNCWVCNQKLGAHKVFLVEPVCAITRTSVLPPAHLECVLFLSDVAHRLTVTMLYVAKKFEIEANSLFKMGEPEDIHFRFQSREATAEEIAASLEAVMPALIEATKEMGADAVQALRELYDGLIEMLPSKRVVKQRKIKLED